MNKALLIGRLGADPKSMPFGQNERRIVFSIATNNGKDKAGVAKKPTWHNITCFGKIADICEQYLKKGSLVLIEGKIDHAEFEKDGHKSQYTSIVASSMEMLGSKQEDTGARDEPATRPVKQEQDVAIDDDVPF